MEKKKEKNDYEMSGILISYKVYQEKPEKKPEKEIEGRKKKN